MNYKICPECRGQNVRVPASAIWHAADQTWVLDPHVGVDESDLENGYCDDCQCSIVPIDSAPDEV